MHISQCQMIDFHLCKKEKSKMINNGLKRKDKIEIKRCHQKNKEKTDTCHKRKRKKKMKLY